MAKRICLESGCSTLTARTRCPAHTQAHETQRTRQRRTKPPVSVKPRHIGHRWERLRKRVIASSDVCALCGVPVDKRLRWPRPWSPSVDLVVPLSRGGSWTDERNLQLTHLRCNISAGDKGARRRSNTFRRSQAW